MHKVLNWLLFAFMLILFAPLFPQGVAGALVAVLVVFIFHPRKE